MGEVQGDPFAAFALQLFPPDTSRISLVIKEAAEAKFRKHRTGEVHRRKKRKICSGSSDS